MRSKFDTTAGVTMLDFEELAARYQTTSRTVRRWHAAGVDVADALAVAIHLASIQHPAPAALDACQEILTEELNELSNH